MTLVVDATVVVASVASADGFSVLGDEDLVAPALMWSEARSTIHLGLLNGKVSPEHAAAQHERLETCAVRRADEPQLGREAWKLAEEFGWGRTYDAEYVALARLLGCRLVTLDGPGQMLRLRSRRRGIRLRLRLRSALRRRGTDRLGFVVAPDEL